MPCISGRQAVRDSIHRTRAVINAELHLRFRRISTIVVWLIVASFVYIIIPDVHTEWALMRINGLRVQYTSTAVALGTAVFCSIFLSLLGFYLVSNSIVRDQLSGIGVILAATPTKRSEIMLGKFLGNVVFLSTVPLACMASSMLMFLLRGEGILEAWVFVGIYLWVTAPTVLFCSAVALAFESHPFLAGRVGDVLYFFIWLGMMSTTTAFGRDGNSMLDVSGVGAASHVLQAVFRTGELTIGGAWINPTRPTIPFPAMAWSREIVVERILACLPAIVFTGFSILSFHRFDPDRVRLRPVSHRKRNPVTKLNEWLKPVLTPMNGLTFVAGPSQSIGRAIGSDVLMTLARLPLTAASIAVCGILSVLVDYESLRNVFLPIIVILLLAAVADISAQDFSTGMIRIMMAAPKIGKQYVLWKFLSILCIVLSFTLIPQLRLLPQMPSSALSLFVGSCFIAACATTFGMLTRSPKFFLGFTLMLLYISLNSSQAALLDFVGLNARATPVIQLLYIALTIGLLLGAELSYRFQRS